MRMLLTFLGNGEGLVTHCLHVVTTKDPKGKRSLTCQLFTMSVYFFCHPKYSKNLTRFSSTWNSLPSAILS